MDRVGGCGRSFVRSFGSFAIELRLKAVEMSPSSVGLIALAAESESAAHDAAAVELHRSEGRQSASESVGRRVREERTTILRLHPHLLWPLGRSVGV